MGKFAKTTFNIGGMVCEYELNLNAMIRFEEETGKDLSNMKPGDKIGLKEIRALLWAGLNEHEQISIEEVGEHINPGNMEEISEKLFDVYEKAMPEGESKGKNTKRSAG